MDKKSNQEIARQILAAQRQRDKEKAKARNRKARRKK